MTKKEILDAIKDKLIAQTWTGSSNVVFPSGSVVVSKALANEALATMTVPICQIIPGGGKADPQYDEDPNLLIFPVTLRLITLAQGDAVGENPLMGANRADTTLSEGAGLYDIESEVYNAVGKLNVEDGIVMQFRNQGDSGAEYVNGNVYLAFEEHNFEAIATVAEGTSSGTTVTGAVVQAANETATTATLANVDDLVFAVASGTTYYFRYAILFSSDTATIGIKLGLTCPAFTSFTASARIPVATDGTAAEFQGQITFSGASVTGTAVPTAGGIYLAVVEGIIRPSASGSLQCQFAAETTGGTVTVYAGSSGTIQIIV